ncbi:unnamed protein product [Larinioides sclopetarius]|uniref:Uncharacterized protein n=1 Tax=Larinioides sclopetarius TaxID=280406 RepID=A0AAV1ZLC1_9ARAC
MESKRNSRSYNSQEFSGSLESKSKIREFFRNFRRSTNPDLFSEVKVPNIYSNMINISGKYTMKIKKYLQKTVLCFSQRENDETE